MIEAQKAALVLADQAENAAAQQKYQRASDLYAEAASAKGLETPLQWKYRNQQALMLAELGREFKNNTALEQAIELYQKTVLDLAPKSDRHEDWATTQHNLGHTLGLLGQRQRATHSLERAILIFGRARARYRVAGYHGRRF